MNEKPMAVSVSTNNAKYALRLSHDLLSRLDEEARKQNITSAAFLRKVFIDTMDAMDDSSKLFNQVINELHLPLKDGSHKAQRTIFVPKEYFVDLKEKAKNSCLPLSAIIRNLYFIWLENTKNKEG